MSKHKAQSVSTPDGFDSFLDDATHAVHAEWTKRGGRRLTIDELYQVNDALTGHFADKRGAELPPDSHPGWSKLEAAIEAAPDPAADDEDPERFDEFTR